MPATPATEVQPGDHRNVLDRKVLQKTPVLAMAQAQTCHGSRKCTMCYRSHSTQPIFANNLQLYRANQVLACPPPLRNIFPVSRGESFETHSRPLTLKQRTATWKPLLHWSVHRQRLVGSSECWEAGWALQGLPAAHGQRIHEPLAKGADQRVDAAPSRAVPRDNHLQAKSAKLGDRLGDDALIRIDEVQPAD